MPHFVVILAKGFHRVGQIREKPSEYLVPVVPMVFLMVQMQGVVNLAVFDLTPITLAEFLRPSPAGGF